MFSLLAIIREWQTGHAKHLRLGQFFVNTYTNTTWPELFYQKDQKKCETMIKQWLLDNHYIDKAPQKVREVTPGWKWIRKDLLSGNTQ